MHFNAFINFDGNCEQAVRFYADVFGLEVPNMMRFSDAPASEGYEASQADKNRILYTELPLGDKQVMFSDCSGDGSFVCGNNVCLVIGSRSDEEIRNLYNRLQGGGEVLMPLAQTFWSKLYGMVRDQFGVIWQISLENE